MTLLGYFCLRWMWTATISAKELPAQHFTSDWNINEFNLDQNAIFFKITCNLPRLMNLGKGIANLQAA